MEWRLGAGRVGFLYLIGFFRARGLCHLSVSAHATRGMRPSPVGVPFYFSFNGGQHQGLTQAAQLAYLSGMLGHSICGDLPCPQAARPRAWVTAGIPLCPLCSGWFLFA